MVILRQTACMVVNPIIVDNFASLYICTTVGRSVLKLNDGSLLNLFQMVGAWPSMPVVGLLVVHFENTSIQIYWKLNFFRKKKSLIFFIFLLKI